MNGIKMSDCRFYVNQDERTVVCVIPAEIERDGETYKTKYMVTDFIYDHFEFADFDLTVLEPKLRKQLTMPNSFIGKAVCAPEDEWNEETGRLIAFSRAKDKCYKSFFKRANLYVQTLDRRLGDIITEFNDFGMKLEEKRGKIQEKIDAALNV